MYCEVCGHRQKSYIYRKIILPELSKSWKLSEKEIKGFNLRESSFCHKCGSSLRSRSLALAIMKCFPESKTKFFIEWIEWADKNNLRIAEINFCGQLHPYLSKINSIKTSQYQEHTLRAKIINLFKGIRSEDITKLSYKSSTFDLVLHSEVLEHVNDPRKAINECLRVLKPNGLCIFTVPIIFDRKTVRKAEINKNSKELIYYNKPSYHGSGEDDNLVFWEFGRDFIAKNRLKVVYSDPKKFIWVLKIQK